MAAPSVRFGTPGLAALMVMVAVAGGCAGAPAADSEAIAGEETMAGAGAAPNTLTAEQEAAGWRLLFDGETTNGWRGYRQETVPAGWQAVDGVLTRDGPGGDIITIEQFENFELVLDWRLDPGGNSGIFFHATEEGRAVYHSAPEYQLLDDAAHVDGRVPETSAGANYALHAPSQAAANPPGEWNEARVLVDGAHVEHWLNGVKIVEYELWTDDWKARVAASKFAEWPFYGLAKTGHIGLQDHGAAVGFRNIRIRVLPSE